MTRELRTLRQKRLREVGESGQARLFVSAARITSDGLRGAFALRYLVGAGVGRIAAPRGLHEHARAIDPDVALSDAPVETSKERAPAFVTDLAAREAFAGTLDALCIIRETLGR